MDCDDNDFQSQNFQLIGEDNDVFPRSLQSFDPPKYEIDDHFQAHLRFDSLADTGLFLGIQGDENNWIEEFSPRNSAVAFGSSASQTCSISRHDNIWSNAPSSESAQMLVKSVGDDETVSPRVMNTGAETHPTEDSAICGTKSIEHTDSALLTEKVHNSILGSNEDVVRDEQHGVSPQIPSDEKSEAGLDVSLLDQKFHSAGKVVASQCTINKELTSSSGDVSKACLVADELLEVVQSGEPLDNSSTRNSSPDDRVCAVNRGTEVGSNFLSFNTQDGPSGVSNDNAGIGTGKLDNQLFAEQKMQECYEVEMSERSESLQSENKQNETSYNLYGDCKGNDQHFQDCALNNRVCDVKDSSELVSPTDSLMSSPNEGSSNTVLIKNSNGLLEVIAYQVKVLNKDSTGDKSSTCTKDVPSLAVEGDESVRRKSVEIGTENIPELCDIAERPIDFSSGVPEYISKDDDLNPQAPSTKESEMIGSEEERDFATSKAVVDDNNCTELRCSSDTAVKVESSSPMKAEIRITRIDGDNDSIIDPLSSYNSDTVQTEKSAEDECLKGITEKLTGKLDASEHAILKEPCAALLDDAENNLSLSVHDKLAPMPDAHLLVAELEEDNIIHLVEKDNTAQLIDSSGTNFKDCSTVIENKEFSSFETQTNGIVMESDKKVIMDTAGGVKLPSSNNSTNLQQLHSLVEVIVEQKEVAVCKSHSDEKDVHRSSLSVIKNNMDTQISSQPHVVPDSDANGPSIKNFSDGLETANSYEVQVALPAGVSSLTTCQSTEGKNANLAPTNDCDKPGSTETESGNLSSFEPNCGSPTVISCDEHTLEEMECRESNSSFQDPVGPASETTKSSDSFKCTVQDSKVSTTSEDDGNFTFVVHPDAGLSKKDSSKDQGLFSKIQSPEQPQVTTSISGIQSLEQPQISKENSQGYPNEIIKESTSTMSKITVKDQKKQVSARATRKVGISKGDAKEKSQENQGKGRKKNPCSTSPVSDRATRSKTHTEGVEQCLYAETNTPKSSYSPSIQTSNLPDLNSSAPSMLFHQPFTDLQQVQLRAQIFVYGSLIQGVLPDEACMIPAFGGTDGGRSLWERVWRAAIERFHNQKSSPNSSGIHLQYHSEQGISCSPLQSKALNSPADWRDSKVPISATQSSTVSLQSPFQSSSNDGLPSSATRGTHFDSNQSLSPLHSHQTSQIRQYLTNSTPWLSPSPRPALWSFSSQSSLFDSTAQYSAMPAAETARGTPVRDSSIPRATNMQLASPGASLPNQGAVSVSAALVVPVEAQNREATAASTKNASVGEKSRKRKKVSAPEELVPKISVSQPQAESTSAAFITNNLPNSAGLSLSSNSPSTVVSAGLVSATSQPTMMPYYQILGSGDTQQRVIFSKETCTQIEHSKRQAENASACAAAAVRHNQVIWEQMAVQSKSGLASDIKEKLASAAVAAAAATSVAKAAAEVAKVASEAALQAKLMADEALNSSNTGSITQSSNISLDIGKNLSASTPVSIPKGKDKTHGPCPIISTARETTRKRVEAASASIKRAENLDAILRAAEMVAEAVSQVGTVIAMGDPLPFSINELVEAGTQGHWKLHWVTMRNGAETNVQFGENLGLRVAGDHEIITEQSTEQPSSHNERRKVAVDEMSRNNKKSMLLEENYERCKLETVSKTTATNGPERDPMQGSNIQKGSLVEVVSDEDGLRGAWFSAWVLDVKDGKAYVCYEDLLSDEGHDKLKEWVPIESKSDQPPRIRVAHPVIAAKSEGTRKRRREVVGNCNWAVGDRVDAWIRDGWWEGIVSEKSQDDETRLTVTFPAGGDSSIVRAWNLRPSLVWKDGQWIEWSCAKERVSLELYEGDTPREKRQKLGRLDAKNKPEIGGGGMGTLSRDIHTDDSRKLEESRPLNFSAKDVILSVGKNAGEENNTDTFKVRRAGLQKDGSKVVFGVPKPGKKRKFMEVSKHYTDKTEKATERNDSIKFAKYLMPQASQLWRNTSKVDIKGKQATNLNTRGPKSLRSQNVQVRSTVDKEKSTVSVLNGGESSLKTSFNSEEKKGSLETGSFSHVLGKVDITVIESSMQPVPSVPSSKKKSSSAEAEMGGKGKVLSAADQLPKSEVKGSENPGKRFADVAEPRRSNRRIQPTSRLLEGLQSSLIMSKSPSVPQDRVAKTLHRGVSAPRGQSHG